MAVVWLNGEFVDESEAKVSALDRGFVWGAGLYETLRVYGGEPFAVNEHHRRLSAGASMLGIEIPDAEPMRDLLARTAAANGLTEAGVRFTISAGQGSVDPHAPVDPEPTVLVSAWAIPDMTEFYAKGVRVTVLEGVWRALAEMKSTSYAVSVYARGQAASRGFDDALFATAAGEVLEGSSANVFARFGDEVATPPLGDRLLPGVTRGVVIDLLGGVSERTLNVSDLQRADDVFLTSSVREIYSVAEIDGHTINRTGWVDELRKTYGEKVRGRLRHL